MNNGFLRQLGLPSALIFIFFLVLFIYTRLFGPIPFSVNSIVTEKSDQFMVTGDGKVSIKPDIAVIRLGVQANGRTVDEAQNKMNTVINKVSAEVKALGVEEKDIETENYNIYPNYDQIRPLPAQVSNSSSGQESVAVAPEPILKEDGKITGYTGSTNLVVKVRKLADAGKIIDVGVKNGANQIGGVTFDLSDKTKTQNEARQKAVADARKKAQDASKIAGFKLGKLINYQESFNPYDTKYDYRMESAISREESTQLEPGSQDITVTVTLSYEIN